MIAVPLCRRQAGLRPKTLTVKGIVPICAATYCSASLRSAMLKAIARLIERLFAPVFELVGDMPPSAANRLFTPF